MIKKNESFWSYSNLYIMIVHCVLWYSTEPYEWDEDFSPTSEDYCAIPSIRGSPTTTPTRKYNFVAFPTGGTLGPGPVILGTSPRAGPSGLTSNSGRQNKDTNSAVVVENEAGLVTSPPEDSTRAPDSGKIIVVLNNSTCSTFYIQYMMFCQICHSYT